MILCLIMVLGNSVSAMTKSGKSHPPSFLDIPMMCSLNFRHSLCILGTTLYDILVYSHIHKLSNLVLYSSLNKTILSGAKLLLSHYMIDGY